MMQKFSIVALSVLCAFGLSACSETANEGASMQPSGSSMPNVGFSADVTQVAIDACRNALAQEAPGTAIEVTGSEFSQANSAVYMALGPQRAPWRCLVSNDGRGAEVMFMGSEGAL
jgi:ABC-type glycerol-3-phosphate transport system substrate-binding protein